MKSSIGFSLVEVLVAILVLAIGLVGLATLQMAGLRSNQTAYYRSVATELAYDMIDRMRANAVGVTAGYYKQTAVGSSGDASKCENDPSKSCSASELAGYDLARWNNALAAGLPSGQGIVCLDSTPEIGTATSPACDGSSNVYAIKIWWADDRSVGAATTQGFVTSFQLGN